MEFMETVTRMRNKGVLKVSKVGSLGIADGVWVGRNGNF